MNIDSDKAQRINDAIKSEDPILKDANGNPLYSDLAWTKRIIIGMLADKVFRYERRKASESAEKSIVMDENIAT